jgi:hypothetical protein
MTENNRDGSKEYKFYRAQLELYGKLALDRNQDAIDVITQKHNLLTWEQCFHCLKV